MDEKLTHIDPVKSPSLKNWGNKVSKKRVANKSDTYIDCGWGRLIFAHTFEDNAKIGQLLREESKGERDIAFYIRDPQFLLADHPNEFFLDPSHTLRCNLDTYTPDPPDPINFRIRDAHVNDLEAINFIYLSQHMVPIDREALYESAAGGPIRFFVAVDLHTGKVVGVIMTADHVEIFDDTEEGASIWSLAVDAQVGYPGVGTILVKYVLEHWRAKKRRYVDLSVMRGSKAIALYQKLGFYSVPVFILKRKNAINAKLYTASIIDNALNPYAKIIVDEAKKRAIGVEILHTKSNYFALHHAGRTIVCHESLSEFTSAVAMSICADKSVTHALLNHVHINLPAQRIANEGKEDFTFLKKYQTIAVKPADGEQGKGISLLVRTPDELEIALTRAKGVSEKVVLEEFVTGIDLRIVVINFDVIAAAIRKPAEVIGDGKHTIAQLIDKQSRRRAIATEGESRIPIDSETHKCVHEGGYDMDDILEPKKILQVRNTANLHTGGTIHDVTDRLHPKLAEAAILIAKSINIPVVGVDFIVDSPEKEHYYFIEANERPGLANHEPQPTAQRFIDLLFPETISKALA